MANIEKRTPGWGADLEAAQRPGVPMERKLEAAGDAHWHTPEKQREKAGLTRRSGLRRLTPVFGSAQPPRGVSGLIRKMAYRIPEHQVRHWLTLLVADKVEVYGAKLKRLLKLAVPATALYFWWTRET